MLRASARFRDGEKLVNLVFWLAIKRVRGYNGVCVVAGDWTTWSRFWGKYNLSRFISVNPSVASAMCLMNIVQRERESSSCCDDTSCYFSAILKRCTSSFWCNISCSCSSFFHWMLCRNTCFPPGGLLLNTGKWRSTFWIEIHHNTHLLSLS